MLGGAATRPTLDSAAVLPPTPALSWQDGAALGSLVSADAAHVFTLLLFVIFFVSCKGRGEKKKHTKKEIQAC